MKKIRKFHKAVKELKKDQGFTLVEILMVMIISSSALLIAITLYATWIDDYRVRITKLRMAQLQEVLSTYIDTFGRLPCPASLTEPVNTANFGIADDCSAAPGLPDIYTMPGRDPDGAGPDPQLEIRVGMFPVQTIRNEFELFEEADTLADVAIGTGVISQRDLLEFDLTDNMVFDAWGRRFTYAVTTVMAIDGDLYDQNDGAISVVDSTGLNSLTSIEDETALYVIASHGNDGAGGHNFAGNLYDTCNFAAVDGQNCDYLDTGNAFFENDFLYSLIRSETEDINNNDDFLVFSTKDLEGGLRVTDFIVELMPCNTDAGGWHHFTGRVPPGSSFSGRCSTNVIYNSTAVGGARSLTLYNEIVAGTGRPSSDGTFLHETTFEGASDDANVYIRTTIPVRIWGSQNWPGSIHAAIYIDDTLVGVGEVFNPPSNGRNSTGGTGVVLARNQNPGGGPFPLGSVNIEEGETYTVAVYLFTDPGAGGAGSGRLFAATNHSGDHHVDGVIEIMQTDQ